MFSVKARRNISCSVQRFPAANCARIVKATSATSFPGRGRARHTFESLLRTFLKLVKAGSPLTNSETGKKTPTVQRTSRRFSSIRKALKFNFRRAQLIRRAARHYRVTAVRGIATPLLQLALRARYVTREVRDLRLEGQARRSLVRKPFWLKGRNERRARKARKLAMYTVSRRGRYYKPARYWSFSYFALRATRAPRTYAKLNSD